MSVPAVVTFDYPTWTARYPEFALIPDAVASLYFNEATLYCSNEACAIIPPIPRATILNMLTAHIAALNQVVGGQPVNPLVGRISDATEGSVSVSVALEGVPGTAAWFTQTKYGIAAYQAMAPYRTARYVPSPGRFYQPPSYAAGWRGNGRGW